MERKSFLDLPAPPNYVAGLGRGATGFTTRSDIGGTLSFGAEDDESDLTKGADVNEAGLLSSRSKMKEDDDADKVYELIEARMSQRRKKRKLAVAESQDTTISDQFADLKKNLEQVSKDDWLSLPEASDFTKRNKRMRELERQHRRSYNISDSLLENFSQVPKEDMTIDARDDAHATNFEYISAARGKLLTSKLDEQENKVFQGHGGLSGLSGGHSGFGVDVNEYLSQLSPKTSSRAFEDSVTDIEKTRALLKSLRRSEPHNATNWIHSARLELKAKRFSAARKLIHDGCYTCPKNEDVWLENIEITNDTRKSKQIVKEALTFNLKSEKLWLKYLELETDVFVRKRVVKQALNNVKHSVVLWKLAAEFETEFEDKERLLETAVAINADSVDLWLSYANLYENSDQRAQVLAKATQTCSNVADLAVERAKLAATSQDAAKLLKEYKNANSVQNVNVDEWFSKACACENEGHAAAASAIVSVFLKPDSELVARAVSGNHYKVAAALYDKLCEKSQTHLKEYLEFAKQHLTQAETYHVYESALKHKDVEPWVWISYAKEKLANKDAAGSRNVISQAFKRNPLSTELWVDAIDLDIETANGDFTEAHKLFLAVKDRIKDWKIAEKGVVLLVKMGNYKEALAEAQNGIAEYPEEPRFYSLAGQISEKLQNNDAAKNMYSLGTRKCSSSTELWRLLSNLHLKEGREIRAAATLDRALSLNPESEEIWLLKVELEKKLGNTTQAEYLLNQAYNKFPRSAGVWSAKLAHVKKQSEMKKNLVLALQETNSHPLILARAGVNFFVEGKFDKAKVWFDRAVAANTDFGDSWCWLYVYYKKKGTNEEVQQFLDRLSQASPKSGFLWARARAELDNLQKSPRELLEKCSEALLRE